jgi:hypothetical protein
MGGTAMSLRTISVGDEVRFRLAGRTVIGKVREDRGPIGVGGRHLYLIVYEMGKGNPYSIELPRDEIEVVEPQKEPA